VRKTQWTKVENLLDEVTVRKNTRFVACSVRVATVQQDDDDDAILHEIFDTLTARVRADPYAWDGVYAMQIQGLPAGLRAMAATHDLVVSLSQGDFLWHFRHCGEPNLVQETETGLRELGLVKLAELFHEAYELVLPYLSGFPRNGHYDEYQLEEERMERITALTREAAKMNEVCGEQVSGSIVYGAWVRYARAHPTGVFTG